ncbi:MAG: c-type cytochrome [Actinomycetota bacterium]
MTGRTPRASTGRSDARVFSRVVRWGLLIAVAGQVGFWLFGAATSAAITDEERHGQQLYETNCMTCHGVQGEGTEDGPSLEGSGPAAVDFMLSSGRMPLNQPQQQPVRQEPAFTRTEMDAMIAYVALLQPGGPEIPTVDASAGSVSLGQQLWLSTCSSCHGAAAVGDSVGGGQIAPSLEDLTDVQIAEAIRVGPGLMPPFSEETYTPHEVDSIVRYVDFLRDSDDPGGFGLGRIGPVTEGLAAFVVGLGIILLVIRLTGTKE